MNNKNYTQDQLVDLIPEIAYPNPIDRNKINKAKIKKYFKEFETIIEYCQKKPDFIDCMMDQEYEFLHLILEIVEAE